MGENSITFTGLDGATYGLFGPMASLAGIIWLLLGFWKALELAAWIVRSLLSQETGDGR